MLLQLSQKTANPWKLMCAERQQAREPLDTPESFTDVDYRNSWYGVRNQTTFTNLIICWGLEVTSGMAARKIPLPSGMETRGCEQGCPPTKISVCGVVFKPPHSSTPCLTLLLTDLELGFVTQGTRTVWGLPQVPSNMEIMWSPHCSSHESFWHGISSSFATSM